LVGLGAMKPYGRRGLESAEYGFSMIRPSWEEYSEKQVRFEQQKLELRHFNKPRNLSPLGYSSQVGGVVIGDVAGSRRFNPAQVGDPPKGSSTK